MVTFEEIYEEVTETDRSWQNVGLGMGAVALAMVVLAFMIRKLVPYEPRAPRA